MCLMQVGYFVTVVMTLLVGSHCVEEHDDCPQVCNVDITDLPELDSDNPCVVDTFNEKSCYNSIVNIWRDAQIDVKEFLNNGTANVSLGEKALNTTRYYLTLLDAADKVPEPGEKLKGTHKLYCETKRRIMKLTLLVRLLKQKSELPPEAWGNKSESGKPRNSARYLSVLRSVKTDAENSILCNYSTIDCLTWVRKLHNITAYNVLIWREEKLLEKQHVINVLRRIVQPVLSGGMFILGAFLNILMLSIFVRCPQSRSPRNMILLQLAVSDTLSLTVNLPVYHTLVLLDLFPGMPLGEIFEFVRYMCFSIGVFSVVALCFQRYCATLKLTNRGMILRQSTKYSSILVIGTVWLCAIAISMYHAFLCLQRDCYKLLGKNRLIHNLSYILDFLFLALGPFLLIWILSRLTVRHFQNRLAQLKISLPPDAWEELRQALARSTTVLRLTPLVFGVSFIPFYLLDVTVVIGVSINSVWYNCCHVLSYVLVFLQTCFNPISTYVTSSTFRGYLHSHIFRERYDQSYTFDLQPQTIQKHSSIPEEGELQAFRSQIAQE